MSEYTGYEIGGMQLFVQNEKGAVAVFGPFNMETFSVTQPIESPDFILTITSSPFGDVKQSEKTVWHGDNGVIINSSSDKGLLILGVDTSWKNWSLYNTLSGSNIDDWFYKLGNLFAWSVLTHNVFVMHGVILEWNGKGIILTAASGTGKTTHARLWRKYENALIINGDRALIRKEGNTWYACGTPWSGSSGECINRRVPLYTIVFLSRGDINEVEFVKPSEAISRMLPRIIAPQWDTELSAVAIDLTIQCLEEIPALQLKCRPDREAVDVLKEVVENI